MTYADDYSIRDADAASLTLIGDAIDDLLTADGPLAYTVYSPTVGVTGTGTPTWTGDGTNKGTYCQVGGWVFCDIGVVGTTGGSTITSFTATVPVEPTIAIYRPCFIYHGSAANSAAGVCYAATGSTLTIKLNGTATDIGIGASRGFFLSIRYWSGAV